MLLLFQVRWDQLEVVIPYPVLIIPLPAVLMSAEVRQSIADSRAQYFSDFSGDPETPEDQEDRSGDSGDSRKPSYVGLSHAVNGYTPYSVYNGRVKKISPPLQIPVTHPRHLDSVGLVLSQDSYHR